MKLMRKILSSVTAIACSVTVMYGDWGLLSAGADNTYGILTYDIMDKGADGKCDYVRINNCDKSAVSVDIPAEINGLPVELIGFEAFQDCTSLESVTIPNSVKSIGGGAFDGCTSLKSITIPDSVTSIGSYAFLNTALVNNQTGVKYADKWVVDCDKDVVSAEIKAGTRGIASWAFDSCTSLESITIPDGVTSIGSSAFYYCTGLESITVLNHDCEIAMANDTISSGYDENSKVYYKGTIYGYANSTAQTYADEYNYKFLAINDYGVLGDADGDGKVTAKDASLMFSEFKRIYRSEPSTFTEEQMKRCDLNNDGKITAIDVSKVFSIYKENYRRG